MPGTAALAPQIVCGKRLFAEGLGVRTREIRLPDPRGDATAVPGSQNWPDSAGSRPGSRAGAGPTGYRLRESRGGRARAAPAPGFWVARAERTCVPERPRHAGDPSLRTAAVPAPHRATAIRLTGATRRCGPSPRRARRVLPCHATSAPPATPACTGLFKTRSTPAVDKAAAKAYKRGDQVHVRVVHALPGRPDGGLATAIARIEAAGWTLENQHEDIRVARGYRQTYWTLTFRVTPVVPAT